MPRCGRIRTYIQEVAESPRMEKLSFVLPFIVLVVELTLLEHALSIQQTYVVILTSILVTLSIVEIIFVSREIHEHYTCSSFDRELTIRLDDFVIEHRSQNVKKIVEDFIERYEQYQEHRNQVYHIACQILETHKEEIWEQKMQKNLKTYLQRKKPLTIDELITGFIKKHPQYKQHPSKVYHEAAKFLDEHNTKKSEN